MQPGFNDADSWRPVVAIPVRNEEERLPALIAALAAQTWGRRTAERLCVSLVLNNCTDGSLGVVRRTAAAFPEVNLHVTNVTWRSNAHVGRARRLAMETAIGLGSQAGPVVVLTTDADAQPEPGWVDATLRSIAAGADAVGGLIIGDPAEEALLGPAVLHRAEMNLRYAALADQLAALVDPTPHDPWPRHRDHTGASLALRADVYRAVGGLPALPFREDLALVSRLRSGGYRLVHPLDVRVGVSARLNGRAPGGMADCLRGWIRDEADGRPHLVEDPDAILARLRMRRALRDGSPGATSRIETLAADDPDAPGVVPVMDAIARISDMIVQTEILENAA
ncbi:MAG: glycosyltransferase family 2 protein [Phenylobacterium sp.]|nr:glycosyltransferase family 2 protein [Phenylobacterium sp.]